MNNPTLQYNFLQLAGGFYLIFKQRASEVLYSTLVGINAGIEHYDSLQGVDNGICDGTLLCTREGARHKAGCLGKTEPVSKYARKLGNA